MYPINNIHHQLFSLFHNRFLTMRVVVLLLVGLCVGVARGQTVCRSVAVDVPDSIAVALADHVLTPIEGVWSVTDGAMFAVYTHGRGQDGESYNVTLLKSPDLRMPVGNRVGKVKRIDGRGNRYEMEVFTDVDSKGRLGKSRRYKVLTGHSMDSDTRIDDGFITIEPIRGRLRISPWLYFRFFITMRADNSEPPSQLRARRVYPRVTPSPDYPLVL